MFHERLGAFLRERACGGTPGQHQEQESTEQDKLKADGKPGIA